MGAFEGIGGTVRKFNPAPVENESQQSEVTNVKAPSALAEPVDFLSAVDQASTGTTMESVLRTPIFTVVGIDAEALLSISREYTPTLTTVHSVANTGMLLQYMVGTEREYNVTMSFPACGVDTNVFDGAIQESLQSKPADIGEVSEGSGATGEDTAPPEVVSIVVPAGSTGIAEHQELYEKITVDGVPYLSCLSQCLDEEYLHQVIAEATESVFTHSKYVYTLVGPRPLVKRDPKSADEEQCFIETLKLNSYELSVLLAYMGAIEGISVEHGVFDGRSAITFTR